MLYKVKLNWYNDLKDKEIKEFGIYVADSYKDCMSIITGIYGEHDLLDVSLKCLSEENCITFSESEEIAFEDFSAILEKNSIW